MATSSNSYWGHEFCVPCDFSVIRMQQQTDSLMGIKGLVGAAHNFHRLFDAL
ncbi:hypothetical protein THOG05_60222 [Vibrio rotiferianus]|nr:hypothetical protein THOG05_60222 [Vibrio rotiferianus]